LFHNPEGLLNDLFNGFETRIITQIVKTIIAEMPRTHMVQPVQKKKRTLAFTLEDFYSSTEPFRWGGAESEELSA